MNTPIAALAASIPHSWRRYLSSALQSEHLAQLSAFVAQERQSGQVFPLEADVFRALTLTSMDSIRVVLMGQDPYHDDGQAHGLAFSVPPQEAIPPSLRNMLKELQAEHPEMPAPKHGNLQDWAEQGVLLLNTVLTVRAHTAASHQKRGWEAFTDAVVEAVSTHAAPSVFVLWGAQAQKKRGLINEQRHRVMAGVHPSPLSAHRGFVGSKPFGKINQELEALGREPIQWTRPWA